MNKRGHLVNAALLSVGLAVLVEDAAGPPALRTLLAIGVPVTLGALVPDIDTAVGNHRKTFHDYRRFPASCRLFRTETL